MYSILTHSFLSLFIRSYISENSFLLIFFGLILKWDILCVKLNKNKITNWKIAKLKRDTYVKWFLQDNPSRFRLNFKVFHVLWVVWCRYWIYNRTIIISIFIGGRHTQYICTNACILFHIFNVFLNGTRTTKKTHKIN